MVHHQNNHNRYHKGLVQIEGEEQESQIHLVLNLQDHKKTRPKLSFLYLFLFLLVCCTFFFLPRLLALYSFQARNNGFVIDSVSTSDSPICYGSICCDRKSIRTDICLMKGDVRTHSASSSVFVYISDNSSSRVEESDLIHERIKPYTRKWETSIMDTVDELELIVKKKKKKVNSCQVQHSFPAVFFSTGGYTGNVYHEFNDGILPLYITSQHFNKKVVFVLLEYHDWWITKYADILSQLSNYPPIDFNTNQTHCFPEAIVGLNIHDELTIDSSLMEGNKTIRDFRALLNQAYQPRIKGLVVDEQVEAKQLSPPAPPPQEEEEEEDKFIIPINNYTVNKKPKLVILSRNGSRAITNELSLIELAEEIGFQVEVLRPNARTELAKIYMALNSSDVMLGVHGAAMTHFLFMRPSTVFIQVIPLGTDWAAQTYYGDPSIKLGLNYVPYKILPGESSLYTKFPKDDPVLTDPDSVNSKGWEFTKKFYLDGQNVKLNLRRFRKRLIRSYTYSISKRN